MVRKKKAPIRRSSQNEVPVAGTTSDGRCEILGQNVHDVLENNDRSLSSLNMISAAELDEESEFELNNQSKSVINSGEEMERQWGGHPLEDSDDDNDDHVPSSVNRKMPPMLAEIERKIAARERQSHVRRLPNKKRRVKATAKEVPESKRRLQLPTEDMEESCLPPELVLKPDPTTNTTVLHITPRQMPPTENHEETSLLVANFELPNTAITSPKIATTYYIHNARSIRSVWQHYSLQSESVDEGNDFLRDLIKCHGVKWLCVTLTSERSPSSVSMSLVVAKSALEACSKLPLLQKTSQTIRFDIHNALQRVIRGLYQITKAAPIFPSDLRVAKEITAKNVYDLVDNQQLERFVSEQKIFPTMDIPGLVPTLRPYQAAAVRWMLQRESLNEPGDEWKVAWMVLDSLRRTACLLVEANHENLQHFENCFMYCPFNGWIAHSMEEARKLTLDGRTTPVKGGCLAESMGLGKTVEMLACILAHPMPVTIANDSTEPSCKRRLDFEDSNEGITKDPKEFKEGPGEEVVDVVGEVAEFADDDSLDDDNDSMAKIMPRLDSHQEAFVTSNVVTPDKHCIQVEERWIDDMEVGSCICGEVISFHSNQRKEKNVTVLCNGCSEPMHLHCACLEGSDVAALKRLDLRRTFGNETLECVLSDDCPCCVVADQKKRIKSRATVIVCPPTILDQWEREVKKHTLGKNGLPLEVKVYEGVESIIKSKANRERGKMRLLHPHFLADADIILVPFGALMSDIGHSDDNQFVVRSENDSWGGLTSLRRRKKYRIVPSPLLSVHFWRVAIDEAQRVEVTTAKAAKMALKLKADHFWAVSGTPIGQGKLEDIYGLFLFLGLTPLDNKAWFRSCLSPTVDGVDHRIIAMLKDCFWRSTKASNIIKKQLGIPEMTENRVILKFSSIERHFYSTQLSATLGLVGCLTSHSNTKSKKQMERLSESVQRLRAACCHPQVGTHGVTGGRLKRARLIEGNSVAARVLSMEQILDKFIDDARQKCEEAQRLAIMHTNAMAAITRLKSEARSRGIRVEEDDHTLLRRSGEMYRESLILAEKNGAPQLAWGEAVLSGNFGFCPPNSVVNDGYCVLGWKIQQDLDEVWVKVEFQGTGKKLKQLRLKARKELPEALMAENSEYFSWQVGTPVSVLLQVALASDSGEFLDVAEAPVRDDGTWSALEKFRPTNRSRAWRITVKLKQNDRTKLSCSPKTGFYIGLDVQLFEAHIDCDSLQLLHSLHNASHAYESAMQLQNAGDSTKLNEQVSAMRKEANQIESLYKAQPQILHGTCMKKFKELIKKRKITEEKLANISCRDSRKTFSDGWEDGWYNDFLSVVSLYGSESQKNSILERIIQDVDGIYVEDSSMRFPEFGDLTGLQAALRVRLTKIRTQGLGKKQTSLPATTAGNEFVQIRSTRFKCSAGEHSRCMASIEALTPNPGMAELKENSHCRLCKADWNQIGPICKHCRIAIVLQDLRPDSATVAILSAIYSAARIPAAVNLLQEKGLTQIADRARIFFELLEAEEREKVGAWKMWRTHLQLLNDYDELASTKQSTRLSLEGEDLTLYTEDQLNAIIQPIDLFAKYHDHAAKQAMFLGDLRRATGTLRYLQNQRNESASDSNTENCVVCLRALKGECCVLKCGHRFHEKPCFDQILRSNIGSRVSCPLKCRESTATSDVMVATDKSRNDGSRASRTVKGSFGTKVTRIVSDVLTMRDKGEKGVIFSQWHTMLEIVETALWENGVTTTRPQAGKKFKDGIRQFQAEDCSVLLLPLKQAAEGLTLVEATNVFMIEPVMNSGLDQQAINRIHRIGQTKKCFVWRYLIQDTVEMKLDQIRLKNLEEDCVLEGNLKASRKKDQYSAGGCDGGFASKEELLEMLG